MYGYVYKTINEESGMYYIGQHVSRVFDDRYKGSGLELRRLFKSIHKCNWRTTLLKSASSQDELNELEYEAIGDLYKTDPLCLNKRPGGFSRGLHTEKTKNAISAAYWIGHSDESFKNCGKNISEQGRRKLADIHRGNLNPMYGKKGSENKTSKRVICIDTGKQYDSVHLAAESTGIGYQNIATVCRGNTSRKRAGGFRWRYVED